MRCKFCHNADTWNKNAGELKTADELIRTALRYKPYWGGKGGITVSGGEPLLQIDFLLELFAKAKEKQVVFVPGNPFYIDGRAASTMRLNYTNCDEATITEGIRRIGSLIKE